MTKNNSVRRLSPTNQKYFNQKIFGFDIETCNNNKDFVVASLYSDTHTEFFYTPDQVRQALLKDKRYHNSVIFATNLCFDFFGTFFSKGSLDEFFTLFRGSDLLKAESHIYKGSFHVKSYIKNEKDGKIISKNVLPKVKFLDSLNYAKLSVEKMGHIIGLPKIDHPSFLGQYPKNENEWNILKEYNLRDSQITYKFMKYLIFSFEELGATFKDTLASTAMSLFRNKYLKETYYQCDEEQLIEQLHSFYGGRTEAFKRGFFKDYNYYDFNSLYPSVMHDYEYPDPNSLRVTTLKKESYIHNYHGCSNVEIFVPYLKHPLLPFRSDDGRLLFPTGTVSGWYTHIELRKAISLGCVIKDIRKIHYYKKTCRPFKDYVNVLYTLRKKFQKEDNEMEFVCKILLNSLYGKFGQRFLDRDNWVHCSTIDEETLSNLSTFERVGEFFRIIKPYSKPAVFCIPIWASYVSAYGRLKLYDAIVQNDPIYCDTDSLITKNVLPESSELGALKLELKIKEGIVVRPKFYALVDEKDHHHVKIKGLGKRLDYFAFLGMLESPIIYYDKFTKFKEAVRRGFIPNEIVQISKEFSLEDEKRVWPYPFDRDSFQISVPIDIDTHVFNKDKSKLIEYERKLSNNQYSDLIESDKFDISSVGNDISPEEFIKNEIWFELNE